MKKSGFQGNSNPFIFPMEKSVENALGIVFYHWARLEAHKEEGPWQLAMFNDFDVPAQKFINLAGAKTGDLEAQKTLTNMFESEFMDMGPKLDAFDSLTREVHEVNSEKYRLIWGSNRNRFYQGSYEQRLAALLGLAGEMGAQSVPDGETAVLDYRTAIKDRHLAQQTRMDKVGIDANAIEDYRQILIKKLNKNRGGLIFQFGDEVDCQDIVDKYFPLNLLGDRSQRGHYQLIVPKGAFRRICIHGWKQDQKIEITAVGSDVWISTADNADHPIPSGYKAVAGTTVIIEPQLLGDITKKYIIATNVNLNSSCDLIFNILNK